jgi:hypothetical protein
MKKDIWGVDHFAKGTFVTVECIITCACRLKLNMYPSGGKGSLLLNQFFLVKPWRCRCLNGPDQFQGKNSLKKDNFLNS